MNLHIKNAAKRPQRLVIQTISVSLLFAMTSALPAQSQENWNCEETAYYSIYEDPSRTDSRTTSNTKTLTWIDADTIGLESVSLKRIIPNTDTFFNEISGSTLQINQTERPAIVVLTQPQVWMNKFGNLRVRFYRCSP